MVLSYIIVKTKVCANEKHMPNNTTPCPIGEIEYSCNNLNRAFISLAEVMDRLIAICSCKVCEYQVKEITQ